MTDREPVNTEATHVPIPDYYIVQHDDGMNHLVRPHDANDVVHNPGSGTVTTVCGMEMSGIDEDDLLHVKDLFSTDEILEYVGSECGADDLFTDLNWFGGNCQSCVAAHDYNEIGSHMYEL